MILNTLSFIYGNIYSFGDPFTMIIDTRNTKTGSSSANEFRFPTNTDVVDNAIDFLISFGDGNFRRVLNKSQLDAVHSYAVAGIYTLNFYKPRNKVGAIIPLRYELYPLESNKPLKIIRWGQFNNSRACLLSCMNLDLSEVIGAPILSSSGESNFRSCSALTVINGISNIIFSGTTVARIFESCTNLNQSFSLNAPNATSLNSGFLSCSNLNNVITINANSATSATNLFQNNIRLNEVPIMNTPNLANVTNMFNGCTAFNKNISTMLDWTKVTNMTGFMTGKTFNNYSTANYDALLIALDAGGRSSVTLGMGTIRYSSGASTAKANLVAKGWNITDGGLSP